MTFSQALDAAKQGKKIQREGWNGKGLWVELVAPPYIDKSVPEPLPYLYMLYPAFDGTNGAPQYPNGAGVPWLASQTDIMAKDWAIIE